jgi:aminoglycoside phosphotransferase family enzyme
VEYSETVAKVRERYRADLSDAAAHRLRPVTVAHRSYNRAVVAAERIDAYGMF